MLTAGELDSFFVSSVNDGGEVSLTISQGDVTVTIDLTGDFRGNIDMSRFSPGRVRLQLNFDRASGIGTTIQWR
jgi:subtilisin-like proprotein convertase family protein